LQRLKKLADKGFISVFDFEKNPLNIFAGIYFVKNLLKNVDSIAI
jgi:hypothetical protein